MHRDREYVSWIYILNEFIKLPGVGSSSQHLKPPQKGEASNAHEPAINNTNCKNVFL